MDLAIELLGALPDLPLFGPLWSLFRPGFISFLKTVRGKSDDEKIQVINKVVEIMLYSGVEFIAGYIWGLLKGVWEALTDPFVMLWQLGKGLFKVTDWLAGMGNRFFGGGSNNSGNATEEGQNAETQGVRVVHARTRNIDTAEASQSAGQTTIATNNNTEPSNQALGGRVAEMANELRPPAEQVRDNFFDAAQEYFSGSEGSSFDRLREKLGEAWDSAQSSIEGQGAQLADRTVNFLLAPNAAQAGADSAFKVGEFIGWLAGTIITEIVIAYFSAGTVTAAKGVMGVVKWIARLIDKVGDIFGVLFRVIGRLGKAVFKLFRKVGELFARAGRGAIRTVLSALETIANKLKRFADEIIGRLGGRAGRQAGGEAGERALRETSEEATERLGRESAEEVGERGAREAREEAGERGARDAATEVTELPAAIAEASAIAAANDALDTPIPILIGLLLPLKRRYRWIERFEARPKAALGHYSIHMIASDNEIDSQYSTSLLQSQEVPHRPLTPEQRRDLHNKVDNRTISRDEWERLQWDRRFSNRRSRGVARYWRSEKKRLREGLPGTRQWTPEQRQAILAGRTPQLEGSAIEGHHRYNAIDYPQLADDPLNIYPVSRAEHQYRWHGGNWQNDTMGEPLNPLFPEEF